MKTLLLLPDLFAGEGGIARIMRLYLKVCVELAGPGDAVSYLALVDGAGADVRLREVVGAGAAHGRGCGRSKLKFVLRGVLAGLRSDRIVCGHVHHLIVARLARLFRPSLKYYLVAHGIEVWRPFTPAERIALRGAERVFCVSEYSRRQILRFLPGFDPARLVLVPNTFDPRFRPSGSLAPRSSGGPRLLLVSRLDAGDPYKGVDLMIEAMGTLRRWHPAARLRIVGGGNDLPRLEGLVRQFEVGHMVHFTGIIDDVALANEYADCDIFALPSRKEGFGLVYLEAMSFGKPCLAARAGGAMEVVNETVGVLVEYGNIEQIVVAVDDLLIHPRDRDAIEQWARDFSFAVFRGKLAAALSP